MRRRLKIAGLCSFRASYCASAMVFLLAAIIDATSFSSVAGQSEDQHTHKFSWREVWGGADATKDVWLLYTGITLAPLSKDIYSDGLRFRVNSGYGQYQFDGRDIACTASNTFDCAARIKVDVTYSDVLIGYHLRLGELTAKTFAGASFISHNFGRHQTTNAVQGLDVGATAGLEFWLNLGNTGWTSLDLQYTTAHETGSARWRAGWRVLQTLSIGPEARYDKNSSSRSGRIGLFARYDWLGGEISVATGFAQNLCALDDLLCAEQDVEFSPYATINLLSQF